MRKIFTLILLVLTSLSLNAADIINKPGTEVWMIHLKPELLGESDAKWDFCKQNTDGLGFYINTIIWLTPGQLSSVVKVLKENHIKIGIECGLFDWDNKVTKDWNVDKTKIAGDVAREVFDDKVGEETARMEMAKIAKLVNAGGIPDYLNLDGSIRRMMKPGQDLSRTDIKGYDNIDKAIDELIDYMKAWRAKYPNIRFNALTNFPNWGWKGDTSYWNSGMFNGDYYVALKRIIRRTADAGIPISGVTVDYPYDYYIAKRAHDPWLRYPVEEKPVLESDPLKIDWKERLLDLERFVERQGLEFNLILNTESAAMTSDEASCSGTLEYLDSYIKAGGSPRRFIVQNWHKHPAKVVPETEAYTYTWMVKQVVIRIKGKY